MIEAKGRTAVGLPGDVASETWCGRLVDQAVEGLGGLDILVINAGHQQTRPSVDKVTTEDFDVTMKTNLYAMHWITQASLEA